MVPPYSAPYGAPIRCCTRCPHVVTQVLHGFVFNILHYVVVLLVFTAIVSGIIIDSFAELRAAREATRADTPHLTLILILTLTLTLTRRPASTFCTCASCATSTERTLRRSVHPHACTVHVVAQLALTPTLTPTPNP